MGYNIAKLNKENDIKFNFTSVYNKEENSITFVSPLPVSNNHYNEFRVVKKGNFNIVQTYPSKEYVAYKKKFIPYLKQIAKELEWNMIDTATHYYLDIDIYFQRTSQDPTNYFKTLLDAITQSESIWVDDKNIVGRVNRVYYTYNDDCPPRIECKLYPTNYVGIWKNEAEYTQFIDVCTTCRNYKDGKCGRLADYMDYKITKDFDVHSRKCLGYKSKK